MKKLFHLCEDEPKSEFKPQALSSAGVNFTAQAVPVHSRKVGLEWDDRRLNTKCNIDALYCTETQKDEIRAVHNDERRFAQVFTTGPASQERARQTLLDNGLDDVSLSMLESRWSCVSQRAWNRAGVEENIERVVYQCVCGYDHNIRRLGRKRKRPELEQAAKEASGTTAAVVRHAPYDFTACLAHADITYIKATRQPVRIIGYLIHNEGCRTAELKRAPAIPLHPHVYEVAIRQLQQGASITQIQKRNMEMLESLSYRAQTMVHALNHRYELLPDDFSRLYRMHYRTTYNIDVSVIPEQNVHNWLDPQSPHYRKEVAASVFYYAARVKPTDRFKGWLGTHGDDSEEFEPFVGMTDTDTKERGALSTVWPEIVLLLCKFHVRQCWKNRRGTLKLSNIASPWRGFVEQQLLNLEERSLLQTDVHDEALAIVDGVDNLFKALAPDPEAQKASSAVSEYITYLRGTWMTFPMWRSWARRGRIEAARKMNVAIETVLPTTNHLESFNGTLKRKYIPQWQHSGRRLRLDVLLVCLALDIMPRVYARQRMLSQFEEWKKDRFHLPSAPAEAQDGDCQLAQAGTEDSGLHAWYAPDERRDNEALVLYQLKYLQAIPAQRPYELWATCQSSRKVPGQPVVCYWLTVHPSGLATCSCLDWLTRGGACKHLRAFKLLIDAWGRRGELDLPFIFPRSREEAVTVARRNKIWYGEQYDSAITKPCPSSAALSHTSSECLPPHMVVAARCHPVAGSLPNDTPVTTILPPPMVPDDTASLVQAAELEGMASNDEHANNIISEPQADAHTNSSEDPGKGYGSESAQSRLNREAIRFQVQDELEHNVADILPKLHGVLNTINSAPISLSNSTSIQELYDLLSPLKEAMDRHIELLPLVDSSGTEHATETCKNASKSSVHVEPDSKIIPLRTSPEPTQRRKDSYKTR
ncbi:hypothetical protein EVJ58_g3855 [Rhodofomes roseus]|uniref:SWIM-type domain-containing protein n=1 Tax=Rhodofomes roseus TaxID=34475 RepID=A0A4Y9YIT0_9APHY|nr:hypothetical protein EVJ58_g3855 [Rhodofomes roseus]